MENDGCSSMNKQQLKIALTNILINAIDAINSETGKLKLSVYTKDAGFVLKIEDNGCGIQKENLQNIFRPLYTGKPGGLGLGLTSAYNFLRSNHVEVTVESVVGEGTRFMLGFINAAEPRFQPRQALLAI